MLHDFSCLPCASAAAVVAHTLLPCYRTQLLSLKQVPSRRPIHFHHLSSEVSRSSASRPASEQMTIRNEGVRIAPWLRSMLLASMLNIGMPDARMRPRGYRFYRPRAAAPLSLQSQARWALSAATVAEAGRSWLPLAWHRHAEHRHCVWCHCRRHGRRGCMLIFGKLAKLPLCYKRYVLVHPAPRPAPPQPYSL